MLGKSLLEFLENAGSMTCKDIRPILKQLLTALLKLKQLGIIHTDLKPDNIMLVDPVGLPNRIKVIDFGSSLYTNEENGIAYIQTRFYRAPEVILGLPFCEAIDMWSLGCILAELYLGVPLYPGVSEYTQLRYIIEAQGLPTKGMLDFGSKTSQFFCLDTKASSPAWRLNTYEENIELTGENPKENLRHEIESLDEIIHFGALTSWTGNNLAAEQADHKMFIDIVKKMLAMEQSKRITPAEALDHDFISMDHLVNYSDCDYVEENLQTLEAACTKIPLRNCPSPGESSENYNVTEGHQQKLQGNCEYPLVPQDNEDQQPLNLVKKRARESTSPDQTNHANILKKENSRYKVLLQPSVTFEQFTDCYPYNIQQEVTVCSTSPVDEKVNSISDSDDDDKQPSSEAYFRMMRINNHSTWPKNLLLQSKQTMPIMSMKKNRRSESHLQPSMASEKCINCYPYDVQQEVTVRDTSPVNEIVNLISDSEDDDGDKKASSEAYLRMMRINNRSTWPKNVLLQSKRTTPIISMKKNRRSEVHLQPSTTFEQFTDCYPYDIQQEVTVRDTAPVNEIVDLISDSEDDDDDEEPSPFFL
nr:probable serine/threonine-protein kinase dyrk1 [Leptinotarsa decemlineata]